MPEVKLKEWLRMARSTEMVLMILNNEEAMYYRTSNLREQTQADATAVTRTAFSADPRGLSSYAVCHLIFHLIIKKYNNVCSTSLRKSECIRIY